MTTVGRTEIVESNGVFAFVPPEWARPAGPFGTVGTTRSGRCH
jgi:hypothetical protein